MRARPTGAALLGNANNVSGMCQVKNRLVEGAHTAPKVRLTGLSMPLTFEPICVHETRTFANLCSVPGAQAAQG